MRPDRLRAAALIACVLAACHAYQPGTLAPGPGGTAATAGCLDVAITPRPELRAVGPVVEIAVANRCDRPVEIDFGSIRAPGYAAFDPRDEIRPALLDARSTAIEVIEYRALTAAAGAPCFDVSELGGRAGTRPMCMELI